MDIDPKSRDLAIRTIIGEVNPDDGDPGRAGVAAVILNRLRSGRFGKSIPDVVHQRGAFEPWATRRRELEGYSPNSKAYQDAARVFDQVANGEIDDPTGGATHFYSPEGQRALGRNPPAWGTGNPLVTIGGHRFYAPEGKVPPVDALGAINKALGQSQALPALAFGPDGEGNPTVPQKPAAGSLFRDAGFNVGTPPAGAPAALGAPAAGAPPAPAASSGSLFRDAGFALPGQSGAPEAAAATPAWPGFKEVANVPSSGADTQYRRFEGPNGVTRYLAADGTFFDATPGSETGARTPARLVKEFVTGLPADWNEARKEQQAAGIALTASGLSDIAGGNYLPRMPSFDPSTWSAGGYLKTAAGVAGTVLSPATAALTAGIEHPVTALTGSRDIGERAGIVASAIPVGALAAPAARAATRAAGNLIPANRAINALVEAIGPENVPAAIARLQGNPRLTLMDVSDPARTLAQGLIDPAQPEAQRIIAHAVEHRADTAAEAVNHAYTAAMGPAPNTVALVGALRQRAVDVGRNQIEPVLASARPVDTSAVVSAIDRELKPGLQAVANPGMGVTPTPLQQELARFRRELIDENGAGVVDPMRLHDVQSRLRQRAYELSNSATGSDRLLGRDLYDFRNHLVGAIDDATGGAYKPGLAKYRDAKQIDEAFDAGFDTLKNRPGRAGLEDRPEAFDEWMRTATPEEIIARRLGTRADIDQKINGMRFAARQGTSITDIEYNRQKLEALFGEKEAKRLIQLMDDERDIARTNTRVTQQSKTAETHAAQRALAIRDVDPLMKGGTAWLPPAIAEMAGFQFGLPGVGTAAIAALGTARKGTQKLAQMSDRARNIAIARGLTATGAGQASILDQIYRHHAVQRALAPPRPTYSQEFVNALRAAGQLFLPP